MARGDREKTRLGRGWLMPSGSEDLHPGGMDENRPAPRAFRAGTAGRILIAPSTLDCPLPLRAMHKWGEEIALRRVTAVWKPLSLTLSPLLLRKESESPRHRRCYCKDTPGTAEPVIFQPSLRDLFRTIPAPNVETLGYCRMSFRDEEPHPGRATCPYL